MEPTDPRVADVLERAMVARIATVSRHGRPHVNPLYFVVEGGHIHLGTAVFTLASHNVDTNPAVELLIEVETDRSDHRLLRVGGTAVVRTEHDVLKGYRRAVARKYIITPKGLWNMVVHPRQWVPMRRHLEGGKACVLDVTPVAVEFVGPGAAGSSD